MEKTPAPSLAYQAFKKYLGELPEWDGTHRIDTVIESCFHLPSTQRIPNAKARWIGQWIFARSAYLAMNPEACTTFTEIPVLVGPPCCGKSMFIQSLLPIHMTYDLNGVSLVSSYDSALTAQKSIFSEVVEMNAIDEKLAKVIFQREGISSTEGTYLARTLFIGTTNAPIDYSKRFMVLEIEKHKTSWELIYLANNRDQLWAEAIARFPTQNTLPSYRWSS